MRCSAVLVSGRASVMSAQASSSKAQAVSNFLVVSGACGDSSRHGGVDEQVSSGLPRRASCSPLASRSASTLPVLRLQGSPSEMLVHCTPQSRTAALKGCTLAVVEASFRQTVAAGFPCSVLLLPSETSLSKSLVDNDRAGDFARALCSEQWPIRCPPELHDGSQDLAWQASEIAAAMFVQLCLRPRFGVLSMSANGSPASMPGELGEHPREVA